MLKRFDNFWLFFADGLLQEHNCASLIITTILLLWLSISLSLRLSLSPADKTQNFAHLSFNSTLQLTNGISSNLPRFLKYFNSTAIVAFFRTPLAWFGLGWDSLFPNNVSLYLTD